MATVFGEEVSRDLLVQRVGHLSQLAGVRTMELKDGNESGVRVAEVRTGSGLRFQVSLDRGMDISVADYKGIPLAWRSPAGDVHPSFYDPRGTGWARTFSGGLLTGCGLSQAGAPCIDDGEELGLHGRLSHLSAFDVQSNTGWSKDGCSFRVEGSVREFAAFRENTVLRRVIETELGESVITVQDTVVNEATHPSPIMMLYHINLGWPLLDKNAELHLNAKATQPRDEKAKSGLNEARRFSHPAPKYDEQVFYHDLNSEEDGFTVALLANPRLNLGLYVRFRKKELPRFIEWKMMGEGMYVLGLEPANCLTGGRALERKNGTLRFLEPGERMEFVVQIGILEGDEQREAFMSRHHLQ